MHVCGMYTVYLALHNMPDLSEIHIGHNNQVPDEQCGAAFWTFLNGLDFA